MMINYIPLCRVCRGIGENGANVIQLFGVQSGGVAVNHWADEPMVTQDVVVAAESVELAAKLLEEAGFRSKRFQWSINFRGHSKVSIQLSTEDFYKDFPSRSVPKHLYF